MAIQKRVQWGMSCRLGPGRGMLLMAVESVISWQSRHHGNLLIAAYGVVMGQVWGCL
ncbi:hypothetical protein M404DRAFT_992627 [Pisolithus tinctorius Marx 270]|uniref:Uncharacterized protein n=1 Tax=Pisolithus tinctorius Marx 270 TaxID=870435 RepID=A0A0C3KXZ7_PISTI|nr:hypothetical protein M404DRAFT_992627 [Pisolithus tinctorius Marx 270]